MRHNIGFILLLFSPFLCFCQEKKSDSASINNIVRKIDKLSEKNSRSITKNKEVRQYFDNSQFSRIMINYTIDSATYSVAYTEKYYLKGGSLIYAYQSEIFYSPSEGIDQGTKWAGDFYFSNGKLINYVTMGHGRSELDDWDPEKDILQQWKKRKAEVAVLK